MLRFRLAAALVAALLAGGCAATRSAAPVYGPVESTGMVVLVCRVDVDVRDRAITDDLTVGALKFVQSPVSGMAEARVLGILDFQNEGTQDVLTAPDTVKAGEDFELTISTFGGGCEREGDAAVVISPANATVMVYDFTAATRPDAPRSPGGGWIADTSRIRTRISLSCFLRRRPP